MKRLRDWVAIATDRWIVVPAMLTSLVVSVVITAIDHARELVSLRIDDRVALWMATSYVVAFVASVSVGVAATLQRRSAGVRSTLLLEREIEAIHKFPDQNPNPVLRVDAAGRLIYANAASDPIREELGLVVGEELPPALLADIRAAASAVPPRSMKIQHDRGTFRVLAVHVPELRVINLYGTDITAEEVVARFPDQNPNPVLRMSPEGTLVYANRASWPVVAALELRVGSPLPGELVERLRAGIEAPDAGAVEVEGDGHLYVLKPVPITEFGFINVYGSDITARKAVDKFPDENPNPVLRVSPDGRLQYANPASRLVRKGLGVEVGDALPPDLWQRITSIVESQSRQVIEVASEGRVYELLVVKVFEFDFINLYGTDMTAAREAERLLLNVLPPSIADRLRHGEMVIADRFEEMAVLFADVVDFTPLSTRLEPVKLVELLNQVFSVFDRLAEEHRLEKIKTIGDAYMVVGGLTGDRGDHVERVARMGLRMIDEVARLPTESGEGLRIRVGMHVGPAVAGVIGIKKFIYDVWGDTVNTASRLESYGVPGRIQVAQVTCDLLRGVYDFEPRGIVDLKGKGPTSTFLLVPRGAAESDRATAAEATTATAG